MRGTAHTSMPVSCLVCPHKSVLPKLPFCADELPTPTAEIISYHRLLPALASEHSSSQGRPLHGIKTFQMIGQNTQERPWFLTSLVNTLGIIEPTLRVGGVFHCGLTTSNSSQHITPTCLHRDVSKMRTLKKSELVHPEQHREEILL